MPGLNSAPLERTFENAKYALNSALLVFKSELPVDDTIALLELASVVRIPYFISPVTLSTTPMWERGSLSIEFSSISQNQTFVGHVMGAAIGAAPVNLFNTNCVSPAGAKIYNSWTGFLPTVDLRPYDGIVVAHEVAVAPAAADRYVITTQLTFRPFAPFATP